MGFGKILPKSFCWLFELLAFEILADLVVVFVVAIRAFLLAFKQNQIIVKAFI